MAGEHDDDLWKLVSANDEAAFAVLYKRYWSSLFTTVFSYIKDKDACADIVHDIFISIWKRRQQLEIISFQHYLSSAARYKVYKYLQASGKNKISNKDSLENIAGSAFNNAETKFNDEALEQKLNFHLNELPKRCREIFLLSRKEYLTNNEIAQRLHISKRTVENQITQALLHLRVSLKDMLITLIILFAASILC